MADLDIDAILAQEVKKEQYRKDYNQREDVKAKRAAYNKKRQEQAKIARRVMTGEISKEEGQVLLNALETPSEE